jgi:hypothetical protein
MRLGGLQHTAVKFNRVALFRALCNGDFMKDKLLLYLRQSFGVFVAFITVSFPVHISEIMVIRLTKLKQGDLTIYIAWFSIVLPMALIFLACSKNMRRKNDSPTFLSVLLLVVYIACYPLKLWLFDFTNIGR